MNLTPKIPTKYEEGELVENVRHAACCVCSHVP